MSLCARPAFSGTYCCQSFSQPVLMSAERGSEPPQRRSRYSNQNSPLTELGNSNRVRLMLVPAPLHANLRRKARFSSQGRPQSQRVLCRELLFFCSHLAPQHLRVHALPLCYEVRQPKAVPIQLRNGRGRAQREKRTAWLLKTLRTLAFMGFFKSSSIAHCKIFSSRAQHSGTSALLVRACGAVRKKQQLVSSSLAAKGSTDGEGAPRRAPKHTHFSSRCLCTQQLPPECVWQLGRKVGL